MKKLRILSLFAAAISVGLLTGYFLCKAVVPVDVHMPCLSDDKQYVQDYVTNPDVILDAQIWLEIYVRDSSPRELSLPEIKTAEDAASFAEELFMLRYCENYSGEYTVYKVIRHTSQSLWEVILCPVESLNKVGGNTLPADSLTITFTETCDNIAVSDSRK